VVTWREVGIAGESGDVETIVTHEVRGFELTLHLREGRPFWGR